MEFAIMIRRNQAGDRPDWYSLGETYNDDRAMRKALLEAGRKEWPDVELEVNHAFQLCSKDSAGGHLVHGFITTANVEYYQAENERLKAALGSITDVLNNPINDETDMRVIREIMNESEA